MMLQQRLTDVRQTSLIAYEEVLSEGKDVSQKEKVLNYTRAYQPLTRRMLSLGLGLETSTTSARVNSLIKDGILEVAYIGVCPISHKSVEFLAVRE